MEELQYMEMVSISGLERDYCTSQQKQLMNRIDKVGIL